MRFRDAEDLSAYLDGQLDAAETSRLEARLAADAGLKQLLDDLRIARGLLRRVPRRRAPRNFTLKASNPNLRAPQPRAVLLLRYAGALASLLFAFALTFNVLTPLAAANLTAASAPAYGMGGGGGGGGGADPTMEALLLQAQGTPPAEAPAAPEDLAAPTAQAFAKTAPPAESPVPAPPASASVPVPAAVVLILAAVGIMLGGLSIYLDRRTRRNFRSKLPEK